MTQKTSFKSRMKQAFSFFRSDLRACTPLLVVFGLISAVTVVICYTICVVLGEDMTFTGALLSLNFLGVTNSGTGIIEIFQYSSANLIYLISIIFTIIYTVRIYSYLHNKRKADLYGSLPIGRSTLFVTKTASAYLMSIIPTLFFLGVISIITVCTGNSVISELSSMFLKICLGTLASISFFGLIAICCGTMLNSVLMFIAVCVAYPLSAIFIKGIVVGCFDGFYVGIFKDSIIMNALNPLAAYDGINIIYWLIFSVACIVLGAFLAKKRKAERAQSAFAFHLPCYIIKVLVSFLAGMFLGVLFASVNVLGGYAGFVFGFILASVPVYIIVHLILYRGFSKLIKTSIPLGALIIVSCVGVALCCFDAFGYNEYVPKVQDVKSAGFYDANSNYQAKGSAVGKNLKDMADDITDKDTITFITNSHSNLINKRDYSIQNKFKNTWVSMFTDNFLFFSKELSQPYCGYAYKLNDGRIITRAYNRFNAFYNSDTLYDDDNTDIINSKGYIKTYSPIAKAEYADLSEFAVFGFNRKDTEKKHADLVVNRIASGYYDDDSQSVALTGPGETYKRIKDAFLKDIDNCSDEEFKKVVGYSNTFYGSADPDYSDYSTLVESIPDVVCVIQLATGAPYNIYISELSSYYKSADSDTAYTTASYV
ncbi:MAG TPA: ABC transporter permease, partial [Ruminococcus bromii]|nr:ABC transporter permease [Ruminococcus bromii]